MMWCPNFYGTTATIDQIIFSFLSLAVIALLIIKRKRFAPLFSHKRLIICLTCLSSLSIIFLGLAELGIASTLCFWLGMALMSITTPVMILVWWELYGMAETGMALFGFCGALVIIRIFSELLSVVNLYIPTLAIIGAALAPLVSLLFLFKAQKNVKTRQIVQQEPLKTIRPIVILVLLTFVVRIVLTVVLSISSTSDGYALSFQSQLIATGIAALVLFVSAASSKKFSVRNLYLPIVLFVALGFLLLPVLGTANRYLAIGIAWVGYMFLEIFVLTVAASITSRVFTSPLALMGFCVAAFYAGNLAGRFVCLFLPAGLVLSEMQLQIISVIVVIMIILTSVFVLSEERVSTLWGLVDPRAKADNAHDLVETRCTSLAQIYNLTPRETEIFTMLALGQDARRINEELVLSMLTVRTHIRRIYEKSGVHSQQE
jgi:DNA-binding CsgD family transcriptional regulator